MAHLNPDNGSQQEYPVPIVHSGGGGANYVGSINPSFIEDSMLLVVCVCNNFNSTTNTVSKSDIQSENAGCYLDDEWVQLLAWDGFTESASSVHSNFPSEERTAVAIFGTPLKATGVQHIYLGVGGDDKTIVTYGIVTGIDVDEVGNYGRFPFSCIPDSVGNQNGGSDGSKGFSGAEAWGVSASCGREIYSKGTLGEGRRGIRQGDLVIGAFCLNELNGGAFTAGACGSEDYRAKGDGFLHDFTNEYAGVTENPSGGGFTGEISMAICAGNWTKENKNSYWANGYTDGNGYIWPPNWTYGSESTWQTDIAGVWANKGCDALPAPPYTRPCLDAFCAGIRLVPKDEPDDTRTSTTTESPEEQCENVLVHYIWGYEWKERYNEDQVLQGYELEYSTQNKSQFESIVGNFSKKAQDLLDAGQISEEERAYYESLTNTITLKDEIESAVNRVCEIITGYNKNAIDINKIKPKLILCFNLEASEAAYWAETNNFDINNPFEHIDAPFIRSDGTTNWDPSNAEPVISGDDPVRGILLADFPKVITINLLSGIFSGENAGINYPVFDFDGKLHTPVYWVVIHEIFHGLGFNSHDFVRQSNFRFPEGAITTNSKGEEIVSKINRCDSPISQGSNSPKVMGKVGSSLFLKEWYDNYEIQGGSNSFAKRRTVRCCPSPPSSLPCSSSQGSYCDKGPPYYAIDNPWKIFSEIYPIGRDREEAGISMPPEIISYSDWYWRILGGTDYWGQFIKNYLYNGNTFQFETKACTLSSSAPSPLTIAPFLDADNLSGSVLPNTWLFGLSFPLAAGTVSDLRSHAALQFQYIYSNLAPLKQREEFKKYLSPITQIQQFPPYELISGMGSTGLSETRGDFVFGVPLEHRVVPNYIWQQGQDLSQVAGFLSGSNGSHWSGDIINDSYNISQEGSDGKIYTKQFQNILDGIYELSVTGTSSRQDWWISEKYSSESNPSDEYGRVPRRRTAKVQMDPFEIMTFGYGAKGFAAGPSPISGITIGALHDIGYKVDYQKADPFYPNVDPLNYDEYLNATQDAIGRFTISRGGGASSQPESYSSPMYVRSSGGFSKMYRNFEARGLLEVKDDEDVKSALSGLKGRHHHKNKSLCCSSGTAERFIIQNAKYKKFLRLLKNIKNTRL